MPTIQDEQVLVATHDRNEEGKQIDAEERVAEIKQDIPVNVAMSSGENLGQLGQGSSINRVGTAGEFASGMAHQCMLCAHFNQSLFRQWKQRVELSSNMRERAELDHLRSLFLESSLHASFAHNTGPDGDIDVEGTMMSECGICTALSEIMKDTMIVMKNSGCPTYAGPKGEDLTKCFRPIGRTEQAVSDDIRDTILKTAQGQVKRRGYRVPVTIFKPK